MRLKPKLYPVLLIAFLLGLSAARGQKTFHALAQDTIVIKKGTLGPTYYLDGKRMGLPVMDWFMSDHPAAKDHIRTATVTNQLSITGYGLGGVFLMSGILVAEEDAQISSNLVRWGAYSFGAGILLQIISGSFQRSAVRLYNEDIRSIYQKNTGAGYAPPIQGELGIRIRFD